MAVFADLGILGFQSYFGGFVLLRIAVRVFQYPDWGTPNGGETPTLQVYYHNSLTY